MAPKSKKAKKVKLYEQVYLDGLKRPELIDLARSHREAGELEGSLGRSNIDLRAALALLKVDEVDGAAPPNAKPDDIDMLEGQIEALRLRKQAAIEKLKDDTGDGITTVEKSSDFTKLVKPSDLGEKPSESTYTTWRREVDEWVSLHSEKSTKAVLQCLLTALTQSTKSMIFSEIEKGKLTLDKLLVALDQEYSRDHLLHGRVILAEYRTCKRGAMSLRAFLKVWRHTRAAAILAGVLRPDPAGDGWDLLEACGLSNTQRGNVLDAISRESRLHALMSARHDVPEDAVNAYDSMYATLDVMARAFETSSSAAAGDSQEAAALWGEKGGAKGSRFRARSEGPKGGKKGAKGEQHQNRSSSSSKVCPRFGDGCWFGDKCTHTAEGGGGGAGATALFSKGKGKGKKFKFKNDKVKVEKEGAGSAEKKPNWKCKCCASVWATKSACFKCGAAR